MKDFIGHSKNVDFKHDGKILEGFEQRGDINRSQF